MRERNLSAARSPEGMLIDRRRLSAHAVTGRGQTLISGNLDAGLGALAAGAPMLGLYGLVCEGPHALRIARDRALLVTEAPLAVADGWRDGWCATAVDDGWAIVDVEGDDAPLALMQATGADLSVNSPSAALRVVGLNALLVRTASGFRLHVERTWLEALLSWLDGA